MKRIFLALTLIFTVILPVSAHQLETDGSIGAVLHVDPSDMPVSGKSSAFYFEFKDTSGKFSIASCRCSVVITQGASEVFSTSLTQASADTASFSYVFPEAGAYTVQVVGVPDPVSAFQPFSLHYTIRVYDDATQSNVVLNGVLGVLVIAALAFAVWRVTASNQNQSSQKGK